MVVDGVPTSTSSQKTVVDELDLHVQGGDASTQATFDQAANPLDFQWGQSQDRPAADDRDASPSSSIGHAASTTSDWGHRLLPFFLRQVTVTPA